MIGINENVLFSNFSNSPHIAKDNQESVCLSLILVMIHECFGHCKVRLLNNNNNTPRTFFFEGNEYIYSKENKSEAGRYLEMLISNNLKVINYLKQCPNNNLSKKLLDSKLWINDFHEIKKMIEETFPQRQK